MTVFAESVRDLLTNMVNSLSSIYSTLQAGITLTITGGFDHGSNLDVDTVAERLTAKNFACKNGITVKADISNAGIVYVGKIDVTAATNPLRDGFPISAGDSVSFEVKDVNLVHVIGSMADQRVFWIAT